MNVSKAPFLTSHDSARAPMADVLAMGAPQKMPVTPKNRGMRMENRMSSTSRRMDRGAAALAWPMDCRKMAHTFCTQVNRMRER